MMQYVQDSSDDCSNIILGCTNANACNYQENANINAIVANINLLMFISNLFIMVSLSHDTNGMPIIEFEALSSPLISLI